MREICRGLLSDFNSIKVRLERREPAPIGGGRTGFQFHKGTIRTRFAGAKGVEVRYFNSIKVRLELCNIKHYLKPFSNFNSIKVRLELKPSFSSGSGSSFQFHKGTIRTKQNSILKHKAY